MNIINIRKCLNGKCVNFCLYMIQLFGNMKTLSSIVKSVGLHLIYLVYSDNSFAIFLFRTNGDRPIELSLRKIFGIGDLVRSWV